MADEPVRTEVRTDDGWLEFQEYFVHRHQAPEVREVRFDGDRAARPTAEVGAALAEAAEVVVIGPSNPIVSIGPILAVPGMPGAGRGRAAARACRSSRSAAIVGGVALKGPADRMLDVARVTNRAPGEWPRLYRDLVDAFVLDTVDAAARARRSRRSGCGPWSPTRSWPTTTAAPGWRGPSSGFAGRP